MASKNSFERRSGHIPPEVKVDACLTSCYRGGRRLPGCGRLPLTASLTATEAGRRIRQEQSLTGRCSVPSKTCWDQSVLCFVLFS